MLTCETVLPILTESTAANGVHPFGTIRLSGFRSNGPSHIPIDRGASNRLLQPPRDLFCIATRGPLQHLRLSVNELL